MKSRRAWFGRADCALPLRVEQACRLARFKEAGAKQSELRQADGGRALRDVRASRPAAVLPVKCSPRSTTSPRFTLSAAA